MSTTGNIIFEEHCTPGQEDQRANLVRQAIADRGKDASRRAKHLTEYIKAKDPLPGYSINQLKRYRKMLKRQVKTLRRQASTPCSYQQDHQIAKFNQANSFKQWLYHDCLQYIGGYRWGLRTASTTKK